MIKGGVTGTLIGRDRELAQLTKALSTAPAVTLVIGEAGIGKTRLVEEAAAHHPARWLTARCHPHDSGQLIAVLDELADVGAAGCVVLLVEDLQWATAETLQLLASLIARLPAQTHVVLTSRPEAGDLTALTPTTPVTEIRVDPLTASAVHDLAAHLLGQDTLPPTLTAALTHHTAGFPSALITFLQDVQFTGDGSQVEAAVRRSLVETPAPVGVRASMAIRLQEVSEACRDVVSAAAIMTTPVPERLLGAVSGVSGPSLTTAIDCALARGLLHEPRPGLYDHRHTLARRSALALIPPDTLRRLHRQAATALATLEPAPHTRIANHARHGGLLTTWLTHAEQAADHLVATGNLPLAADHLVIMLTMEALPWTDQARLATKLAHLSLKLPLPNTIPTLTSLLSSSPTSPPQPHVATGNTASSPHSVPSASTSSVRGRLRVGLGFLLHQAGEVRAGRQQLLTALEELRDDPATSARVMSHLALPTFGPESLTSHRTWMQRALSLDPQLGNHTLFRLAVGEPTKVDTANPEVQSALAWLGRTAAFLERSEDPVSMAARLRLAFARGDWAVLGERLTRAREASAHLPFVLAELDLIEGRLALARGNLPAGSARLRNLTERTELGPFPVLVAALAACPGANLRRGLDVVRRKAGWASAGDLIIGLSATAPRDDARRIAAEYAEVVRGLDSPAASAAAALAQAIAINNVDLFEQATAQYQSLGWRYYECVVREHHGRMLLADDDPEPLGDAVLAYEALGARGDAQRCRDLLRAAGYPARRKRGRRGYGNTLSPRELQVAQLAAQGRTNKQIAADLSLSVSTIEDHITSTLRKLNAPTRQSLGPLL
ncbi:helix-turn-helix transcriptional regulator [Kribbella sp. NPDC055071]